MSQTAVYTDIQWQIRSPAVQKDNDLTQRQVTSGKERLVSDGTGGVTGSTFPSLAIHILRIVRQVHRKITAFACGTIAQ